jgi:hypothetical protein
MARPGPKSSRALVAGILVLAALGFRVLDTPAAPEAKPRRPAQARTMLGTGAQFVGWRGETALFREDTYRPDRPSTVKYYGMDPAAVVMAIPESKVVGSAAVAPGTVLLADYVPTKGERAVTFHLGADLKEEAALQSAIREWLDEGTGKSRRFPSVHADLIVKLVGGDTEEIVWRQRRILTASAGEGGYVYDPPRLRFAVLSPAGSTLLIELVNGAGSEFIRIPLPPRK